MSYKKKKQEIKADLLRNDLDRLKFIYKFLKRKEKPIKVYLIKASVTEECGSAHNWKVLAAIEVLKKSGAIEKVENGSMTQFDEYQFRH